MLSIIAKNPNLPLCESNRGDKLLYSDPSQVSLTVGIFSFLANCAWKGSKTTG